MGFNGLISIRRILLGHFSEWAGTEYLHFLLDQGPNFYCRNQENCTLYYDNILKSLIKLRFKVPAVDRYQRSPRRLFTIGFASCVNGLTQTPWIIYGGRYWAVKNGAVKIAFVFSTSSEGIFAFLWGVRTFKTQSQA